MISQEEYPSILIQVFDEAIARQNAVRHNLHKLLITNGYTVEADKPLTQIDNDINNIKKAKDFFKNSIKTLGKLVVQDSKHIKGINYIDLYKQLKYAFDEYEIHSKKEWYNAKAYMTETAFPKVYECLNKKIYYIEVYSFYKHILDEIARINSEKHYTN
jgi:hypothetical protein